ncbi:methyl-accepting chemotaxis protein [Marinibacterium profundimaris]|uniref:methyl-accepting chemotaxis protein n=1 Tax=Marinibacterium profundimaris TaxID=1679460 RepID=UPI000B52641F|nr:methyl-accepting chemotaxis protein [Marinibacterium profundimaris]
MTQQTSSPSGRGHRGFLPSLSAKVTAILLAIGSVSAVIGVLAVVVFVQVSSEMRSLSEEWLPEMENSSRLLKASFRAEAAANVVLRVGPDGLAEAEDNAGAAIRGLQEAIAALSPEDRQAFQAEADTIGAALGALIAARREVDANEAAIDTDLQELHGVSQEMEIKLTELADTAYFDLSLGAEAAINQIDETVGGLVENEFHILQELLRAQAEINMLSGMILAMGTERNPGFRSIMRDIAIAAVDHLGEITATLEAESANLVDTAPLRTAHELFVETLGGGHRLDPAERRALLRARQDIAIQLSGLVDDVDFEAIIALEDVSAANGEAVQSLLDHEFTALSDLLDITLLYNTYQGAVMDMIAAETMPVARLAGSAMSTSADALQAYADMSDGALAAELATLSVLADATQGLPAHSYAALEARDRAAGAAATTIAETSRIVERSEARGSRSQAGIMAMAGEISNRVSGAQAMVIGLAVTSALALAFALYLSKRMIQVPLRSISATTERLANGDLAPVTGFERSSEEIRRMAGSLAIFRDGIVEREALERRAEAERAASEQERAAREADQAAAMAAVGVGLTALAKGDLTARIDQQLPEGFGRLKVDFNESLEQLMGTMSEVLDSVFTIRGSASDTTRVAADISKRIESQAATLEQAAAALDTLTTSARHTAQSTRKVETAAQSARDKTEDGAEVVNRAVQAMSDIEESSRQISQIVGVIEDIAFQTNLLALNAGVEAARAGETGRGFAVVASEVRALAQRCSGAAMEIKGLISRSTDQVSDGARLVSHAGDALKVILEHVGEISGLVTEIAENVSDQTMGLEEINNGIGHLDQVTQQNTAIVEETTAASVQLSEEANRLSNLMRRFRTEGSDEAVPSGNRAA